MMFGEKVLTLVLGMLLFRVVLGQQDAGPVFVQRVDPNIQLQRSFQPQRSLSVLNSRPSAQFIQREQQQAFIQQVGSTTQPQRSIRPQRPLSAPQSRSSSQSLRQEQRQGFGTLSGQQQEVLNARFTADQTQGPQVRIVEDIRDGPFHDGSYYFGYVSGDGSVREEGAVPTADGSFIVTGSYSYTAPNGQFIEMQYIADANGYRAFPKGSRPFTPPQRILNAPILPNTPFVDEVRQEFIRPILNQRPQPFRPVINNLSSNQVNRPFNRPGGPLSRPALGGLNRSVGNVKALSAALPSIRADLPDSEGSFSTALNEVVEPTLENNI